MKRYDIPYDLLAAIVLFAAAALFYLFIEAFAAALAVAHGRGP